MRTFLLLIASVLFVGFANAENNEEQVGKRYIIIHSDDDPDPERPRLDKTPEMYCSYDDDTHEFILEFIDNIGAVNVTITNYDAVETFVAFCVTPTTAAIQTNGSAGYYEIKIETATGYAYYGEFIL